ncbi:hypothetical protein [Pseudomonas sp.]|uniref:hypothetical protein n=1 Tax=Pseudomonas sp. TaxID=306 RepID=UPI003F378B55
MTRLQIDSTQFLVMGGLIAIGIYLGASALARSTPDLKHGAALVVAWFTVVSVIDIVLQVYQAEPYQLGILANQKAIILIGSGVMLWLAVGGIWTALTSPLKKKALKISQPQ